MAQPPPSRLSLKGLLSLPYRLCNPPPAVGKVRSCSFTPVLDVRLDDVLARRHLPPIGLKDLEEYLLYVERTPENLYFILWLKDYTARYHAWAQREKTSLVRKTTRAASKAPRQKFPVPPTPDPSLAMFYLRAKQTFFTPKGEYELNIPSDVLAPFHSNHQPHDHNRSSLWHSQSIHPDPAVFAEVAIEARGMLNESLSRFARAAYTNVGSGRAICGILGGCFITLFTGVIPMVLTTGRWNAGPHGRLIRLVALPGLWLGLTILIASLQGICLMVYIFGDLRQLRKFELARPTISRPIPMPISAPTQFRSTRVRNQTLLMPPRIAPLPEKMTGAASSLDSPVSFIAPSHPSAQFSDASFPRTMTTDCESCESEVCSSVGCNEIDVSPAFFDDVPAPEGPATASCLHRPEYRLASPAVAYLESAHVRTEGRTARVGSSGSPVEPNLRGGFGFGPTAGFIPNDYGSHSTSNLSDTSRSLRSQKSSPYFDFDLLPASKAAAQPRTASGADPASSQGGVNASGPPITSVVVDPSSPHPSAVPPSPSFSAVGPLLGRAQYKCNEQTSPAVSQPNLSHRYWFTTLIPSFTAGVPAFAAPLTQIQSQVVKRAQWEVVVRAALLAAMIAGALIGVVVGVVL